MQFIHGSYQSEPSNSRVIADPSSPSAIVLQASAAKTATGAQADAATSENVNACVVTVQVTAVSGTTPTLVLSLADAATAGGSYTIEASSPSINATGTYQFLAPIKNLFYRAQWVIGGTTPSFTFEVKVTPFIYGVNP